MLHSKMLGLASLQSLLQSRTRHRSCAADTRGDIMRQPSVACPRIHREASLFDRGASAAQAACLYTVLLFAPDVLHRDSALMRVLVDKHFVDSWVLAWAPGFTSDIAEEWGNYKARAIPSYPHECGDCHINGAASCSAELRQRSDRHDCQPQCPTSWCTGS